ncbi:MAG: dockerin type I repeat-containing protein, partial [Ruminococcus sp.]|nr:dockerin type I repeat-containing protein [Ruminococcus sp.]
FKNLPAGENYFFSVIADPAINYDPFYEYSGAFPSQFTLGAEQWDYYPTGSSETVYTAEPGQRLMKFNLDINADVDIFFDDAYYDIYSGTGGNIILRITPIRGDVNGDAEVDITDATDIQYALAQLEEFTPAQERNADVDGDGQMSIKDVTRIQKYLAGMIESL